MSDSHDPFTPSTDPDIPTPTLEDLLRLVHGSVRDQLAAGTLDARHAQNEWTGARRSWDEGHKRDAERRRQQADAQSKAPKPGTEVFELEKRYSDQSDSKIAEDPLMSVREIADGLLSTTPIPEPPESALEKFYGEMREAIGNMHLRQAAIAKQESDRAKIKLEPDPIKPEELSVSTADTLQQPLAISLQVADDVSSAMRDTVGGLFSGKPTTKTATSGPHKGAILASAVSSTLGAAALNVLNQKYGASIPDWVILLVGYVAVAFWLYWAWQTDFVRGRRLSLLYTKRRMLTVFAIAGALIGGLAGIGLWLVNRNEQRLKATAPASPTAQPQQADAAAVSPPASAEDLRLTRIEFGTNSAKPLRSLRLDVMLKQAFTSVQLGHFRVLIDFGETDDVIPNVWIGLRDNYAHSYSDGKNELILGLTGFVRGMKPEIRETQHEMSAELVTDHMNMDFNLDKTPYRTIDDLNHKVVHVYVTESLIDKIQTLTLSGNNYILIETDAKEFRADMPPKIGYDSFPWPFPLTQAELSQPWKYIVLGKPNAPFPREGATMFDFDRNIPRKSLGNLRE